MSKEHSTLDPILRPRHYVNKEVVELTNEAVEDSGERIYFPTWDLIIIFRVYSCYYPSLVAKFIRGHDTKQSVIKYKYRQDL